MAQMTDHFTAGNRTYSIAFTDDGVAQLREGENRMSSLGRRACYKCGNVGHYAGKRQAQDLGGRTRLTRTR
jgi:hypothetical protein